MAEEEKKGDEKEEENAEEKAEDKEEAAAKEEAAPKEAEGKEEKAEEAAAAEEEEVKKKPRTRIGQGRCVGLVVEWKGYMGWIQPLAKIQHEQAKRHQGRIYLNQDDVSPAEDADFPPQRIKEGKLVDFFIYSDADGLGAEECRPRLALRLTLPHGEAGRKLKDNPRWSEYLTDSEYYPTYEREHGVLLRKYSWPLPFAVLELWGHPDALVEAAIRLSTPEDSETCDVRLLVPEDQLPKVESLPGSPKVSGHVTVPRPLPCRSLMLQTSKEESAEGIHAFLKLMAPAPAPAGGGA